MSGYPFKTYWDWMACMFSMMTLILNSNLYPPPLSHPSLRSNTCKKYNKTNKLIACFSGSQAKFPLLHLSTKQTQWSDRYTIHLSVAAFMFMQTFYYE
jgi:hypothetical protein